MANIGCINTLKITELDHYGASLDAGELGEIILLNRNLPANSKVGDLLDVFIYHDSKDRLAATTQKPKVQIGEAAFLNVLQVNNVGAFLDWGLPKDLLVPYNQQQISMVADSSYVVFVYLDDDTGKVVASSKLNKHIHQGAKIYKQGQAVDLLITDITDIGYSAIINNQHWGVLYFNDVVRRIKVGQRFNGFIKQIRDDEKINLSLEAIGYEKVDSLSVKILRELEHNDGFIPLSDKSAPELIYQRFSVSKKSFKMTIGTLYKKRLITISREGITLVGKKNG
ncbi:MAG: putative RNA-binding protein (virulence factor B family) [Enterobacterales bacterium]